MAKETNINLLDWFKVDPNQNEKIKKKQQEAQINKLFRYLDENNDGTVSHDEFIEGMKALLNIGNEFYEDLEIMFNCADKGSDHKLTEKANDNKLGKKEFRNFMMQIGNLPDYCDNVERFIAHVLFKLIDKDKSDQITKSELKKFVKSYVDKSYTDSQIEIFMSQLDSDVNCQISETEFIRWYCEM